MAKIKNVSGQRLIVPGLSGALVMPGQVVEVADDDAFGYTQQVGVWEPADKAASKLHNAAAIDFGHVLPDGAVAPPEVGVAAYDHTPALDDTDNTQEG